MLLMMLAESRYLGNWMQETGQWSVLKISAPVPPRRLSL
jgi:hypothetical protein